MRVRRLVLPVLLVFILIAFLLYALSVPRTQFVLQPVPHKELPRCKRVPSFHEVWHGYQASQGEAEAAVYTPFHITPGGGEKYLLSVVQALQYAGYTVTVYTGRFNSCRTKEDLLATAAALKVSLIPEALSYKWWRNDVPRVRVFFALGNDKFPDVPNIGLLGFFMCQFPFDLAAPPRSMEHLMALRSYDHVLVNSRFSFMWYNTYITPTVARLHHDMALMPSIDILHPPCSILTFDATSPRQNIVMLGRLFSGRQSKGQQHAIRLFAELSPQLPTATRLVLIGQLVQKHDAYLQGLRYLASSYPQIAGRVDFVVSQPPEVLAAHLQSAFILWHMTGLNVETERDPASREHFGISIVETMSAGTIPVALHGGPDDIIEHGVDGFLATIAAEMGMHTLQLFRLQASEVRQMQQAAVKKAQKFSYESFQKRFIFFLHRGLFTRPFRHFIASTMLTMKTCAALVTVPASPYTAMIVEGRNHYALEYVLYNVMSILHKSSVQWSLHIYYTSVNYHLIQRIALAPGLRNAHLHELPPTIMDVNNYNQMMKTEELWRSLGDAQKVLVFQTDSLIVNPGIEEFLVYDYVGAPWHQQNERWEAITELVPPAVGNGGLSLRNVSAMQNIAKLFGKDSMVDEQEDIFYAKHVHKDHKLCPRVEAYSFCLEVPCDDLALAPDGPFAVHAAWYYNPLDDVQQLLYHSLLSAVCSNCLN